MLKTAIVLAFLWAHRVRRRLRNKLMEIAKWIISPDAQRPIDWRYDWVAAHGVWTWRPFTGEEHRAFSMQV